MVYPLPMLRILGKPTSLNVRKVLWLCAELDLAYEREDWGSGYRDTNDPQFTALNPNAQVPVILEDDGFVLWESNSICRYLTAKAGRSDLLPTELRARANVERWMDWQLNDLNMAWSYAFQALVRRSPVHDDPVAVARSLAQWNRLMGILDGQLAATGGHVAGPKFTLADLGVGLATHRWMMTPMDQPDLPAVAAYYDRLSERPGFLAHGRNGIP